MMQGCPVKFRILEYLEDGPKMTNEIADALAKEYTGYDNPYGKAMIKYDCNELVSAGILKEGKIVLDEEGIFQKGKLLVEYSLTNLGIEYLEGLKKTVKVQ